jgi:hypothetical protein
MATEDHQFRVVVRIPIELLIEGDSEEDVREQLEEGGDDLLMDALENGVPAVATMTEVVEGDPNLVITPATDEDRDRILGEADPEIDDAAGDDGRENEPDHAGDE